MNEPVFTLNGVVRELRRAFKLPEGPSLPRSVRYWATEGLLRPTGAVHTGKGRNRIFPKDEVLRAAILFECSKWNITAGTMKALFQVLDDHKQNAGLIDFIKDMAEPQLRFAFTGWPMHGELIHNADAPKDSRSVLCIGVKDLVTDLGF